MALSTASLMTCSHLPASWWASAHDSWSTSVRKRSARRWRRTTFVASTLTVVGEVDAVVRLDQALGLEAAHHLADGGTADVEALGDARLDDVDVVLGQLEDALAVLLERRVMLSDDSHASDPTVGL